MCSRFKQNPASAGHSINTSRRRSPGPWWRTRTYKTRVCICGGRRNWNACALGVGGGSRQGVLVQKAREFKRRRAQKPATKVRGTARLALKPARYNTLMQKKHAENWRTMQCVNFELLLVSLHLIETFSTITYKIKFDIDNISYILCKQQNQNMVLLTSLGRKPVLDETFFRSRQHLVCYN